MPSIFTHMEALAKHYNPANQKACPLCLDLCRLAHEISLCNQTFTYLMVLINNLHRLRDAQRAGKTLFWGMSVRQF